MARKYSKRQSTEQLNLVVKEDCTALYVRVSTEKQADEGYSLEAQQSRLVAFCEAQQWHVCVKHIYIDAGISGKTTDRAQFQAMMQAAKDGLIKRIVTIKLDRLARNTRDFLATVETLQSYSCDLVLIKESFDTSTPHGKFALTMFAAIAELEASQIAERVMTGKVQKASVGGYNGSQCPLGYDYNGQVFTVNAQSRSIAKIFQSFVDGQSMSEIAKDLNARGATTAKGGKWYTGTVRYILQNGFYAGLAQYNDTEVTGSHPAIISRALYEAAHGRLQSLKPGPVAV